MKLVKNLHSIPAQQTASSPLQNVIHTKPRTQQKSLVCHYLPSSGFLCDIFPSQQIVITPNRSSFLFLPGYLLCLFLKVFVCLGFGFVCPPHPSTQQWFILSYCSLVWFHSTDPHYRGIKLVRQSIITKYCWNLINYHFSEPSQLNNLQADDTDKGYSLYPLLCLPMLLKTPGKIVARTAASTCI